MLLEPLPSIFSSMPLVLSVTPKLLVPCQAVGAQKQYRRARLRSDSAVCQADQVSLSCGNEQGSF